MDNEDRLIVEHLTKKIEWPANGGKIYDTFMNEHPENDKALSRLLVYLDFKEVYRNRDEVFAELGIQNTSFSDSTSFEKTETNRNIDISKENVGEYSGKTGNIEHIRKAVKQARKRKEKH